MFSALRAYPAIFVICCRPAAAVLVPLARGVRCCLVVVLLFLLWPFSSFVVALLLSSCLSLVAFVAVSFLSLSLSLSSPGVNLLDRPCSSDLSILEANESPNA